MKRIAPYGKTVATGLTERERVELQAVGIILSAIDALARIDPDLAGHVSRDLLGVLLGPRHRGLLAYITPVLACLLAHAQARE
jgi:hypothetical protein